MARPSADDIEVRDFRVGDGPPLLAAWQRAVPYDALGPARFRTHVLLDENFDPRGLRVASADGEIVGAAYGVRRLVPLTGTDLEPDRGWIPFFFVAPGFRRHGLGRRLLTEVLDWLAGHGRTQVDFSSYTPHYILPGLDEDMYPEASRLLAALGFRSLGEAVAMDRTLVGYRVPEAVRAQAQNLMVRGYRFATPSDDDLVDLLHLAASAFAPDWAVVIRRCLAAGAPLERIVCVREPSGRMAGWAMHGAYEDLAERFGPFGVLADARGGGLGAVLLHLTLERMRMLGLHGAWFLWTGDRTPAGQLYRAAGFATTRTFRMLRHEAR
jgi:GNAT superfamily N-acetyltransferase